MRKAWILEVGLISAALAAAGCLAPDAVPGSGGAGGAGGAAADPLEWARGYGVDAGNDQRAWSLAATKGGDAIVAGDFENSFTVGSLPPLPNTAGKDGFVFALDPMGKPLWLTGFAGVGDQRVYRAIPSATGGLFVGGSFTQALGFAGQELGDAPDGEDGFVAALDAAQALTWIARVKSPGRQTVQSVAANAQGEVVIAGTFQDALTLGDITLDGSADDEIFVAKIDAAGKPLWAQSLGGKAPDLPLSQPSCFVELASDGSLFVAGSFAGTLHLEDDLGAMGTHDMFVGKLDSAGNALWGHAMGAAGADQRVASLAVGPADAVLLSADVRGKVTLAGGTTVESAGPAPDALLAVFDSAGVLSWARRYGSAADDHASSATFIDGDDVLFAGQFRGAIEFSGDPPLLNDEAQSGADDIFFVRLAPDHSPRWARSFGAKNDQVATSVAVAPEGHPLLAGWFRGTLDFGAGPLDANNGADIFVARFGH